MAKKLMVTALILLLHAGVMYQPGTEFEYTGTDEQLKEDIDAGVIAVDTLSAPGDSNATKAKLKKLQTELDEANKQVSSLTTAVSIASEQKEALETTLNDVFAALGVEVGEEADPVALIEALKQPPAVEPAEPAKTNDAS